VFKGVKVGDSRKVGGKADESAGRTRKSIIRAMLYAKNLDGKKPRNQTRETT
jgi:hypothetical protein